MITPSRGFQSRGFVQSQRDDLMVTQATAWVNDHRRKRANCRSTMKNTITWRVTFTL